MMEFIRPLAPVGIRASQPTGEAMTMRMTSGLAGQLPVLELAPAIDWDALGESIDRDNERALAQAAIEWRALQQAIRREREQDAAFAIADKSLRAAQRRPGFLDAVLRWVRR